MNVSVYNFKDSIAYLIAVHAELQSQNARLSLRSWSKNLGLKSPTLLSMALSRKRPLTSQLAHRIGEKLPISAAEKSYFLALNAWCHASTRQERAFFVEFLKSQNSTIDFEELTPEKFLVLNQWYHFAILESSRLKHFKSEAKWIANTLSPKIPLAIVKSALSDLIQLGLIINTEAGMKRIPKQLRSSRNVINTDVRQIQHQLIENAGIALNEQPPEDRDVGTFVVATTTQKLLEAKSKVEKFRLELGAFLDSDNGDVVVALNTQLFCLSNFDEKKNDLIKTMSNKGKANEKNASQTI